ncbi:uncharacterized protein B4U80_12504, partial [Leptotrombidium deliense]
MCDNSTSKIVVEGGRTKAAEIDNLEPNTAYRVMMRGLHADNISSELTSPLITKTTPGPPSPPKNFRYLKTMAHEILLAWDIDANNTIDEFDVKFKDVTVATSIEMVRTAIQKRKYCNLTCNLNLNNSVESYRLNDIEWSACVKSAINGVNRTLCSKSVTLKVQTAISAPSQMEKPHAEPVNRTTLQLTWKRPEPANGPIDIYKLIIWSGNRTEEIEVDGNTTT